MTFRVGLTILLVCFALLAVQQGQISGTVSDENKTAVAGAKLTATNNESKQTHHVATNASGAYVLKLPEGTYDLLVESASHVAFQQKVYIVPGADNTVNIQLTAAAVVRKPGKR
ncbi:MAG: carboxypeptidase regulatory-like domain-containing protein [Acidobacteria bacterium]|nr:carboxypeptidase regulatory-like domain-containing protein [Acidobacteriota bacterium]